jgi:DnaK suppressor protein
LINFGKLFIMRQVTQTDENDSAEQIAVMPEGYTPSEKEEYMNPVQLEYFRQKLLHWKYELLNESGDTIQHLREENWASSDIADRAILENEVGVELKIRSRYFKLIQKINRALKKIKIGAYGYCEKTKKRIGVERLSARPIATLCIAAQEDHENYERSHMDPDDDL